MRTLLRRHLPALACAAAALATSLPAAAAPPLASAPAPAPAAPMRSPALVAGGGVLLLAGVVGTTFGIMRLTVLAVCPGTCPNPARNEAIGGTVLGLAVGALAAGVVLVVYGTRPPAPASAGAPAATRALPAWAGEPGGAGWGWRF